MGFRALNRLFALTLIAVGLAGCASDFDPGPLGRRPPGVAPRVVHAAALGRHCFIPFPRAETPPALCRW